MRMPPAVAPVTNRLSAGSLQRLLLGIVCFPVKRKLSMRSSTTGVRWNIFMRGLRQYVPVNNRTYLSHSLSFDNHQRTLSSLFAENVSPPVSVVSPPPSSFPVFRPHRSFFSSALPSCSSSLLVSSYSSVLSIDVSTLIRLPHLFHKKTFFTQEAAASVARRRGDRTCGRSARDAEPAAAQKEAAAATIITIGASTLTEATTAAQRAIAIEEEAAAAPLTEARRSTEETLAPAGETDFDKAATIQEDAAAAAASAAADGGLRVPAVAAAAVAAAGGGGAAGAAEEAAAGGAATLTTGAPPVATEEEWRTGEEVEAATVVAEASKSRQATRRLVPYISSSILEGLRIRTAAAGERGVGGWRQCHLIEPKRKDDDVLCGGKNNRRFFLSTSLNQGGIRVEPQRHTGDMSISARQFPSSYNEAATTAAAEAAEKTDADNTTTQADVDAATRNAALPVEIKTPIRILRSSCTDILRNLSIESVLIDVCSRSPNLSLIAESASSTAAIENKSPISFHSSSSSSPSYSSSSSTSSSPSYHAADAAEQQQQQPHHSSAASGGGSHVPSTATGAATAASPTHQTNGHMSSEGGLCGNTSDSRRPELPQASVLFLWRNEKTIVIGRHQNAWKECDICSMERDGVTLARRYSGGGAVYQDLGNTCFTFLDPAELHCKLRNSRILLHALRKKYDITGSFSGRNDLLTEDGRKFSGFAYSKFPHMWLHHGTLMREVDCEALARYLTPSKAKLQSKGVSSVAARVANLRTLRPNITHDGLCTAIAASFAEQHGWPATVPVEIEDVENLLIDGVPVQQHPLFRRHFDVLASWDWRFSRSPAFSTEISTRFQWGSFDIHLNVENAIIADIKIYSDCMHPDLVDALTMALKGCRFTEEDLKAAIRSIKRKN